MCRVATEGGDSVESDYVVVALPLGVLQSRSEASAVTFAPPLSEPKRRAIAAMGMGTENKAGVSITQNQNRAVCEAKGTHKCSYDGLGVGRPPQTESARLY